MEYTNLGRTGIRVSRLGLGGAPFSICDSSQMTDSLAEAIIDAAFDHGINYIDTAAAYGDGESERRIGLALRGRRGDLVLATKAVQLGEAYDYDNTIRCVEGSLRRLGTDYIDLIQLHNVERTTFDEAMNGTVAAFLKLKEDGKVRAIGINGGDCDKLLPFLETGVFDTTLTYGCYMLIDQSAAVKLLPLARKLGIGVVNGSVLGAGILADQPDAYMYSYKNVMAEAKRRLDMVSFLRHPGERGMVEPALRFSLASPDVDVTVVGAASVQAIVQNAMYCDGQGLPPETVDQLFELYRGLPRLFSLG